MIRRTPIFAGAALILAVGGLVLGIDEQSASPKPFPVATVHFEQNATDGDVEVVFEVKGGDDGLAKLTLVAPDGRVVVDVSVPDASTLGIRQFRFESPEPKDVEGLKSAYPEGVYAFNGATHAADKLRGASRLSHDLPDPTSFLRPEAGARGVDAENLEIAWAPVENAAAYIIEIEQRKLDVSLTTKVPGSTSTFAVPKGFLRPGTKYQLGIGAVSDEGNVSFAETSFSTREKE